MANIADDISHAYQDGYNDGYEKGKADAEFYLLHCGDTDEPQTNADRIRSMTDEELAEWIAEILTFHNVEMYVECEKACPLYYCCNDQPTDNIEGWLGMEVKHE